MMGTTKMAAALCLSTLLLIPFSPISAASVGPPARPMIIGGEILLNGLPVAEGTTLKVMVAQTEWVTATQVSEIGISYYRVVLPPFDPAKPTVRQFREGDQITFLSLGEQSLADLPPCKWHPGPLLRNVLVKTAMQRSPDIVTATAAQDADSNWQLTAGIGPASGTAVRSYRIQWLLQTEPASAQQSAEPGAAMVATETITFTGAEQQSYLTHTGAIDDTALFTLYITPLTAGGKQGPSARQTVYPLRTGGEL